MGYYLRFIVTDDRQVDLSLLEGALKTVDSSYQIADRYSGPTETGNLVGGGELYGQVEINRPGDGLFEEELEELKEEAEEGRGRGREAVPQALKTARALVAIQVLWQDRETDATLERIDPLWHWLFANRKGLPEADREGYHDQSGHILQVE